MQIRRNIPGREYIVRLYVAFGSYKGINMKHPHYVIYVHREKALRYLRRFGLELVPYG